MNIWNQQQLIKSAYSKCTSSVCEKYHLTRMELNIILFLANNPEYDTATDIIEVLKLTKSHISASIKSLECRGLLSRDYRDGNRKTAHLLLSDQADEIIREGRLGQQRFISCLFQDFTLEEQNQLRTLLCRTFHNIEQFLKEDSSC